jgi:putative MATE family efflux protein
MPAANSDFLGKDPLLPLLMRLSIPAVVGMMVMALYNIIDSIFVGRGVGSLGLAGLAIVFPIQISMGALGQMVGVGSASVASRMLGEGRKDKAEAVLGLCIFYSFFLGILVTIGLAFSLEPILKLFGASAAILPYAKDYVVFLLIGIPVQMASMSVINMIRAEGRAKTAMNVMLAGIILNIILDPIFIFGLDMGIKGAALATVIGQTVNFVLAAIYYLCGNSVLKFKFANLVPRFHLLNEITVLGLPNFVQMAGGGLIAIVINNILGVYAGDIAISTYGIIVRLTSFLMMPLGGIAQGFQPIAGFNYGAQQFQRVRQVFLLALGVGTGISTLFFVIVMTIPHILVGLFTTDQALLDYAVPALRVISLCTPIVGLQMISAIYFQAIGRGRPALLLGLSRQILLLLPMVIILSRFFQASGVWAAFPISDFLATLITCLVLVFELRKLNGKINSLQPEMAVVTQG